MTETTTEIKAKRTPKATHKCPVVDCERMCSRHILICQYHFASVPPELKKRITDAYREKNRADLEPHEYDAAVREYVSAARAAIASVSPA